MLNSKMKERKEFLRIHIVYPVIKMILFNMFSSAWPCKYRVRFIQPRARAGVGDTIAPTHHIPFTSAPTRHTRVPTSPTHIHTPVTHNQRSWRTDTTTADRHDKRAPVTYRPTDRDRPDSQLPYVRKREYRTSAHRQLPSSSLVNVVQVAH